MLYHYLARNVVGNVGSQYRVAYILGVAVESGTFLAYFQHHCFLETFLFQRIRAAVHFVLHSVYHLVDGIFPEDLPGADADVHLCLHCQRCECQQCGECGSFFHLLFVLGFMFLCCKSMRKPGLTGTKVITEILLCLKYPPRAYC